jgi:MFS family permease
MGIFIGSVATGWIVDLFSWRAAFFFLGIPGFLLALAVLIVIREPKRGQFDDPSLAKGPAPKMLDVAKRLLSKPSFVQLVIGMALVSIVMSGLGAFLSLYLVREFSLSLTQVGLVYGIVWGLSATVGASVSGYVCDRFGRDDKRWHVWLPGALLLISAPLFVLSVHMSNWQMTAMVLALPVGMTSFYLAPSMALINNMVSPRMRATAIALVGLVFSVCGGALGPYLVGAASDHFFLLQDPTCSLHTTPGVPMSATCVAASAQGLRTSLSLLGIFEFWAAIHYFLASRRLRNDLAN